VITPISAIHIDSNTEDLKEKKVVTVVEIKPSLSKLPKTESIQIPLNKPTVEPIPTTTVIPRVTVKPTKVTRKKTARKTVIRTRKRTAKSTPVKKVVKSKPVKISSFKTGTMTFRISAYDLSVQSCGKSRKAKGFGRTCSGFNLANKSRTSAMTVAADLRVFKLGTRIFIKFSGARLQKYNGVYTVRDTGGAVRGKRLDLFMGDGAHNEAMRFGVQTGNVRVVK